MTKKVNFLPLLKSTIFKLDRIDIVIDKLNIAVGGLS